MLHDQTNKKILNTQNILIIGNGSREYSIALALRKDKKVKNIFFSPQNPAATLYLESKHIDYKNYDELLKNIKQHNISLVIIGPEAPLMEGISDFLESNDILVFAPSLSNAKLEGSKAYMKSFISNLNIPTAKYKEISLNNKQEGYDFIESMPLPIVLKASGLCGGKGVLILDSKEDAKKQLDLMLDGTLFGDSGRHVVIEEFLDGYELSIFALSSGNDYIVLPACQDHKRLFDNDKGPNTGGMGAYTNLPHNLYNKELEEKIKQRILTPTFKALKDSNTPYKGVIFAGIMVVDNEPYLLEYNVRFGDPECEVLMPLLKTSVFDIIHSFAQGKMIKNIEFHNKCVICVVMASSDYAQNFKSKEYPAKITFNDINPKDIDLPTGHIVFANTIIKNSMIYANSGRSVIAVGIGDTMQEARNNAYNIVSKIEFNGKHYRKDIAHQALK